MGKKKINKKSSSRSTFEVKQCVKKIENETEKKKIKEMNRTCFGRLSKQTKKWRLWSLHRWQLHHSKNFSKKKRRFFGDCSKEIMEWNRTVLLENDVSIKGGEIYPPSPPSVVYLKYHNSMMYSPWDSYAKPTEYQEKKKLMRVTHTRKKRGVYTLSIIQLFKKKNEKK